jgi:beta-aspartyl-peptidase (threonine type)
MWAIILHGGAKEIDSKAEDANRSVCLAALQAGRVLLEDGGTAVEAIEAAIRVLEDDPTFNAGYGSDTNEDGEVEMCSGIMNGETLDVGAVAAIMGVRHPITVARLMLQEEPILLVADGARRFATESGAELCDPREMIASGGRMRKRSGSHDTVGCVALDQAGNVAVGTSTGGLEGVAAGRVGDSPQPGCGYYAEGGIGAVAFSGDGEHIARMALAARTMLHLSNGETADVAIQAALHDLERIGGEAGGIGIDANGRIGWAHSSRDMVVAYASSVLYANRVFLRKSEEVDSDGEET